MVAKALMTALDKAATQTMSSAMKIEFLEANDIVFKGSKVDLLARDLATLTKTVTTLVPRFDSVFPQANNVTGSVTAVVAPSTMMVGNRTGVASSSSSAPFQRSQGEKASEEERTMRKRSRRDSSSSSIVQATPSPAGLRRSQRQSTSK